jgi:hypothetical protein
MRGESVWRICVGLLAACAALLGSSATAGATPLSYTFDSSNQGWEQNQDQGSTDFDPAGFQSTRGNPGGHLQARDSGPENGCPGDDPCELLTFYSPIVTPLSANYNGIASFDLRTSDAEEINSAAELLLLAAGDNYLDGLLPAPVSPNYNRLSIPLTEAANWRVCPYAGGACTAPSQTRFKELIGATDQIAVMVDIASPPTDGTGETYDLDNVTLTEGAAVPVTPTPPPQQQPPQQKKKCKKRAGKSAKKKCKKRRAGKKRHRAATGIRG